MTGQKSSPQCSDTIDVEHDLLQAFEFHLTQHRGVQRPECHLSVVNSFLGFLANADLKLTEIGPKAINDFLTEQGARYQRKTLAAIASCLRVFFRYLVFAGVVEKDFSQAVKRPRMFQGERDPRYLKPWQVKQVLAAVDRQTVRGKRDYALLLLLAIYGLRAAEAAHLRLDDLRWRARKIVITHRKCSDKMELPMVAAVGRALADYLQVRPDIDQRNIFLTDLKPIRPLKPKSLATTVKKAIVRCDLGVAHPGSHSFRFSLAQTLFQCERPLGEIAEALGHRDLRTTLGYLSFVVHPLREVAINEGEELS